MKRLIVLAVVLGLLLSMLNMSIAGTISVGMTKKQVTKSLGEPKHKEVNGPYELWIYLYRDNLADEIFFKDGEVEKIVRWVIDDKGRKVRIVDVMVR